MTDQTRRPQHSRPLTGAVGEGATGRRRFVKSGLAATPVLMTLVSRPVLGQQCLSPSAFCSGNLSAPNAGAEPCNGVTPGYWKQEQHFDDWPSGFQPTGSTSTSGNFRRRTGTTTAATMFHSIETGFKGAQFEGKTLLDVLKTQGGAPADVGRHVGAALLNALTGRNAMPGATVVRAIWNEYATKGYYEPTAGVQWDHNQICDYLKTTQPL